MRFTSTILSLTLPLLAVAAPTRFTRRADADVLVFTFADVLEQLETEFYRQGIEKFKEADFVAAGFSNPKPVIETLQGIQTSESTHSKVLQAALKSFGKEPLTSCKFDFTSALVDVPTMAATARVVENVGVSAYIGGATLLTDPILLAAAGTILSTEARHQTMLNVLSVGTAIPAAFDIAMTPSEILSLASPFMSGCDLGIKANPTLAVKNTGTVTIGTKLDLSSPAVNSTIDGLFCQMMVGGASFSIPLPLGQCVVPEGINGPVAIWITSDGQPLINDIKDRATSQLVAGPAYAFVDSQQDGIGQILRGQSTGSATSGATVTTETVTPAAAQSIIDNASGKSESAAPAPSSSPTQSTVNNASGNNESAAPSPSPSPAPSGSSTTTPSSGPVDSPNNFIGKSPDGKTTVMGWI